MTRSSRAKLRNEAVEGILLAYAVIDAANRFREVLRVLPGMKQDHTFEIFMRGTSEVEKLRNILQHLNRELDAIGTLAAAPLGTITWLGPSPVRNAPPSAWALQPGSFYQGQQTYSAVIDRLARLGPGEIGQVTLAARNVRVDLTATVSRMRAMLEAIEPGLRAHARGKPRLGSDVLLGFALRPVDAAPPRGAA